MAAVTADLTPPTRQPSFPRRAANFFYRHRVVSLLLLLLPTLFWLGVVYLGSLSALLAQSFFSIDDLSGRVIQKFTFKTYQQLFTPANVDIMLRTVGMAAAVTVAAALIAFPLAYYMARHASYRVKGVLYLGVMLPLWSSYLVRVYAWKLILAQEGIITWLMNGLGLGGVLQWLLGLPGIGGPSLSFSYIGLFMVFVYIWLPYMILPITTALERVPKSVIEASGDLGARPGVTFRTVTLPLAFPGVVAGSIFTFSLTLGDYIIPGVFGNSSYFIGQAVVLQQGTAGNIPLAAAFTVVPVVIMGVYLLGVRRLGAFDAL
jgi:putative spermidine/putrescine transport system permease protein